MTVEFKKGNLLAENTEALVNPVNCVGIMGKGLALQFKNNYPDNFESYRIACTQGVVQPGKIFAIQSKFGKYIINFPTKNHWRDKTKIGDIAEGLEALVDYMVEQKIASISIPALGCGNGGLQWSTVKPLILHAFKSMPQVRVVVFEPL